MCVRFNSTGWRPIVRPRKAYKLTINRSSLVPPLWRLPQSRKDRQEISGSRVAYVEGELLISGPPGFYLYPTREVATMALRQRPTLSYSIEILECELPAGSWIRHGVTLGNLPSINSTRVIPGPVLQTDPLKE